MGKLHDAAQQDDVDTIHALLAAGHNVNEVDDGGYTVLMVACRSASAHVAETLLKAQAITSTTDSIGRSAIHIATLSGSPEIIQLLRAYHADLNVKDMFGWTPLTLAARSGDLHVVEVLLAGGVEVDIEDNGSWTPLYHALWYARFDIAQRLIHAQASPLHRTRTGWTAFHILSAIGWTDQYAILGWTGDPENLQDYDGRPPSFYLGRLSSHLDKN